MARIVFMGTPQFAVPTLEALHEHHQIVGIVTQPDRPAGRGRKLVASPVKETALALDLPFIQPPGLHTEDAQAQLAGWQPDVIVVAAFGQILRPAALDLPPHGCLNVHASLLPQYRGATPIPAAILAGDPVTGVTIMRMEEGLDTGPILVQAESPVEPCDTTATLTARLADLGARTLVGTLPGWLGGQIQAQPQDESEATYCQPLEKSDGLLDWTCPADYLDRQVRACDPWPGAYTTWKGQRLKVLRASCRADWQGEGEPGQTVALKPGLGVFTGAGVLELVEGPARWQKAHGCWAVCQRTARSDGGFPGHLSAPASPRRFLAGPASRVWQHGCVFGRGPVRPSSQGCVLTNRPTSATMIKFNKPIGA